LAVFFFFGPGKARPSLFCDLQPRCSSQKYITLKCSRVACVGDNTVILFTILCG